MGAAETQSEQHQHTPELLLPVSNLLVSASVACSFTMTPPAPVLAALALSGFALLACLAMLALTLQREIDVEV